MNTLIALLTLASLIGGGVSTYKNQKYKKASDVAEEKQRKQDERKGLQGAIARTLGVDTMPYEKPVAAPKAPDTMWSDMLQAGASSGAQGLSQYQGSKMYPMDYPQPTTATPKTPRRTPQGYAL
jgi:hypothetical protein